MVWKLIVLEPSFVLELTGLSSASFVILWITCCHLIWKILITVCHKIDISSDHHFCSPKSVVKNFIFCSLSFVCFLLSVFSLVLQTNIHFWLFLQKFVFSYLFSSLNLSERYTLLSVFLFSLLGEFEICVRQNSECKNVLRKETHWYRRATILFSFFPIVFSLHFKLIRLMQLNSYLFFSNKAEYGVSLAFLQTQQLGPNLTKFDQISDKWEFYFLAIPTFISQGLKSELRNFFQ